MSEQAKTGMSAWEEFCNLPDLRKRINQAGVLVRADEAEAEIDRLHEEQFTQSEHHRIVLAVHEQQIGRLIREQVAAEVLRIPTATPAKDIVKLVRRDALDAVIDTALRAAPNPDDYQSVYAEMVKLAASPSRLTPLIGPASRTGIPYQKSNGEKAHFTPRALKGRLKVRLQQRP
jgi:hypothetical protein